MSFTTKILKSTAYPNPVSGSVHPLSILLSILFTLASLAVLANNVYYLGQGKVLATSLLLLLGFALALSIGSRALIAVIFLLPLSANLHHFLELTTQVPFLALPNAGIDLVAGTFLGLGIQRLLFKKSSLALAGGEPLGLLRKLPLLWPVSLALLIISFSTAIAISRNIYLSATQTSLKGVLFNLMHFRPIDWRADFMPIGDWVSYTLAVAFIVMLFDYLQSLPVEKRNAQIFKPLAAGLAISAAVGIFQSITGFGLTEAQLSFRKDILGFAAMGLQPDLHAFASHMLLGVVGLWGYFWVCKSRTEKFLLTLVFALSFIGLIASKSRASLIIAIIALIVLGLVYLHRTHKSRFYPVLSTLSILIGLGVIGLWGVYISGSQLPGLQWINELLAQVRARNLTSLSDLGGMMGSRFEIWSAAINMISSYPLMGVGQGEFYHLSSNISFSKSEFLRLNGGENAHNYFLQTFAELGLIGIGVFLLAFIFPLKVARIPSLLYPAAIALLSLFLGNVFAHAFLVRENLLLAASLLALMYSLAYAENPVNVGQVVGGQTRSTRSKWLGALLLLCFIGLELFTAYGRLPFIYGADCFIKEKPVGIDGWTSGAWEEKLLTGTQKIELQLSPDRPGLERAPLIAQFELLSWEAGKGKVPIARTTQRWISNTPATLKLELPKEYINSPNLITARLEVSSCFTPRDLGINTDARRLGVKLEKVSSW